MSDVKTIKQPPPPVMSGAILCTIPQAAAMVGRGQTWVYNAIAVGQIDAKKSDGRTLVVIESVHRYAAGLPSAKLKPHAAFKTPKRRTGQSTRDNRERRRRAG